MIGPSITTAIFGGLVVTGCFGSSQHWAQLHLTEVGGGVGQVTVIRSVAGGCNNGICTSGIGGHGTTAMAYDPHTDVALAAQPSTGSRFASWAITVYQDNGAWATTASTEETLVVHDAGEQLNVIAKFDLAVAGEPKDAGGDSG